MNGLPNQPKFAAFSLTKHEPFGRKTDDVTVILNSVRNDPTVEFQEETKLFPLVVNSNDVADRTSYARSLSSATSDVEARIIPELKHGMENGNINNPILSRITFHGFENKTRDDHSNVPGRPDVGTMPVFSYGAFIGRTWTLVVVSVAVFGACVSLWMLIYVFIKMCDGTLAGSNQTMGVFLLIGVTCLFARYFWFIRQDSKEVEAIIILFLLYIFY